jgi:signal peptidase I
LQYHHIIFSIFFLKENIKKGRYKNMINRRIFIKEMIGWIFALISAVFIALCIKSYAFASPEIRQNSMQNTLIEGQRVIEYKIEYYFSKPKRNDIVIINQKAEKGVFKVLLLNSMDFFENFSKSTDQSIDKERLIKRIIGIPGDEINIKDKKVYINGVEFKESYIKGNTFDNGMKFPIIIPHNKYFVMGDNREVSLDSRILGLIDINNIEGKAVFRVWPLNKFGGIYH